MSIYENTSIGRGSIDFSGGDPLDTFSQLSVYVPFDSGSRDRRPIEQAVPGHPGKWVCVYSTFDRLSAAYRGDEVEWSSLPGEKLLALVSDHAGIWFDRSYPGGRKILTPPVDIVTELD